MNSLVTKKLGNAGEDFVASYLVKQGFIIQASNYRKFYGEVDIIASKKQLYIFVEVKTRSSVFVSLNQLISPSKQAKIIKTAQAFIAQYQISRTNVCRFDVALLVQKDGQFVMEYIENAFTQMDFEHGFY